MMWPCPVGKGASAGRVSCSVAALASEMSTRSAFRLMGWTAMACHRRGEARGPRALADTWPPRRRARAGMRRRRYSYVQPALVAADTRCQEAQRVFCVAVAKGSKGPAVERGPWATARLKARPA